MNNKIKVTFNDSRSLEVYYKTKAIDVVKMVEGDTSDILALNINNELRSYDYELVKNSIIKFVKYNSPDGYRVYSGTLKMVLYMALTSLFSNTDVEFIATIKKDQYFMINNIKITDEKVQKIKEKMQEIIDKDFPITKKVVPIEEATVLYTAANNLDILKNIDNKLKSYVTMYFCDGMYNNFSTILAPSTGYIKKFDIRRYKDGLVLMLPDENGNIKEEIKSVSLYDAYMEFNKLNNTFGISTIGDLNRNILQGKTNDIIQVAEAIHDRKLVELVQNIEKRKNIKMVLIAGPSSSGKTTFAQKLGVQLKLTGYNPITISMDNYFKERKDTPLGEDGKYNFETVDALDIELFNSQMKDLIDGKTVELPEFDFVVGTKKYNGKFLKLEKNDVMIIEGIHALNPILTKFTPDENKYKVYIAPITTLNIDGYTKISSSDSRFLRRMVRDYTTRGHSVDRTFELWGNVKKGEEEYIFPFVDDADFIYNSSLNYEPSVMKTFAQPLLLQVDSSSEFYSEARRLYAYLNNFTPLETGNIPINSIIREFIGNGCFNR
ncbi:tGS domain-containing protein [Clostridium sp. CAG:465]|nr:tGS domain-containing protein [Clostridium sp. CAG:465]